ncbi:uncharacterized protein MKK02DRAFT_38557 [Dioszegia hungarica]|uniref:Autophagy-related protein 101 n=1 Tax=Dioszegia hungarica TaxID=4972 RepID=A0AA38H3H7_9TREE|nr:uncharacterized protein MKK02DRAFT_38557 [Dioszegia hungarica]KAI9633887.1 hypothetical protein MKK02DRAFT_38557 [Dioszegia hungarica]
MDAINQIELTLPIDQIKPVLSALILSILFQRTLDPSEPQTIEVLGRHVAIPGTTGTGAAGVEGEVSGRVEEFMGRYYASGRQESGQIAVIFTQKKSRKGWFGITEEIVPWEAHFITIHPDSTARHSARSPNSAATSGLYDALMRTITFCAARADAMPSATPGEADRLAHQIIVSPPPPSDLFAPSPPTARSPLTPRVPLALPAALTLGTASSSPSSRARRGSSPGRAPGNEQREVQVGYLEQAKDVLRATGARAGAVAGWTAGRGRGT